MTQIRIFLSAVSAEFRSYRDALRHYLDRPNVMVKVQEDFIATGTETLDMLDDYISQCDAVVHLIGDMTGAMAQSPSLTLIRERYPDLAERLPPLRPFLAPDAQALSYTQWEAWLALYHRKMLIIAVPVPGATRDEKYALIEEQRTHQQQHLARLASVERYPAFSFENNSQLAAEILRSKLHEILTRAGPSKKRVNLPIASLGSLFKGRAACLEDLELSLGAVPNTADHTPVIRVLSGLGGTGKTRLALEYAWQHGKDYSAQLFIVADSVVALQRNLAGLCRTFDLDEQHETDEAKQRDAVLKWFNQHPGWLFILDNVDTEEAAAAVEALIPQLWGGHLLVTSRLTNWSGSRIALSVNTLSIDAATEFLLERTNAKRRKQSNDNAQARILADTLGALALALEQAGAYIAQRRMSFEGYLEEYHKQYDRVLTWNDPRLTQYPKSVVATWQTTFDQLSESARQLLQHLAWLSPAPIPESLLDVLIGDGEKKITPYTDLAELESYSLVTRATDSPSFSMHRLVQKVSQLQDSKYMQLNETLQWINAAFVGSPQNVRNWPVLNPLQPHVQAVITYADKAGITAPVMRLMNDLGLMFLAKSLYDEAEPLMRRALAIDEASFGADHPDVARDLNNLAQLLHDTNRLSEAEPLMQRALAIDETSLGADHPNVAIRLNNLARLFQATNRLTEAEPLFRRALAIDEASFEENHPRIAIRLNNLALLLQATNRLTDAETLLQRALAIDEANFGENHPRVATDLNNLAELLRVTNRLVEAEPLIRRALAINEASFEENHPNVAYGLNNLALLLHKAPIDYVMPSH
mgnify:CR=1 FL=1